MAKPILVARFPIEDTTLESNEKLKERLKEDTNNEYHILLILDYVSAPLFEIIQINNYGNKNKTS